MTKKLNVKRVIAAVAVATTIVVAPITYVATVYVAPTVAEAYTAHQVAKDEQAVDRAINNVVSQVTQYCNSHLVDDGTSQCGFYKSQEIVKWMDEEDYLHTYTVEEAQALLTIRDLQDK